MDSLTIIGIGGIGIGVIGVLYAIKSRKEFNKKFEEARKKFEESRSYITIWENQISEVAGEIKKSKKSIKLALDTLAYGYITANEAYKKYWSELIRQAALELEIDIITLNEGSFKEMLRTQFGNNDKEKINSEIEQHFDCIDKLKKYENVKIYYADNIPFHEFIFDNKSAIYVLHELPGGGDVITVGFKTHDDTVINFLNIAFDKIRGIANK